MSEQPLWEHPFVIRHSQLLVDNFERLCQQSFPVNFSRLSLAEALYTNKDWVIVSHGTEEDPIFNYANQAAQRLWKISWNDFTKLPSRLSAKADKMEKRDALLRQARQYGFVTDYRGIRIDSESKEFYIDGVTLFNLHDEVGNAYGQAAIFDKWQYL